jgi:hypothetical protein
MLFLTNVIVKAISANETLILDDEDRDGGRIPYTLGDFGVLILSAPRGQLVQPQIQAKVIWDKDLQRKERSVLLTDLEVVGLQQYTSRIVADFAQKTHS